MANEYMEISEKTLDDCITMACRKLSITSDKLDYEVIDQGSAGFMGFNARNAVIRARVKQNEHGTAAATGDVLNDVHEEEAEPENSYYSPEEAGKEYTEDNREYDEAKADTSSYNRRYSGSDFTRSSGRGSSYGRGHGSRYGKEYGRDRSYSGRRRQGSADYTAREQERIPTPRKSDEPKVNFTDEQIEEFQAKADQLLEPMFHAMGMEVDVYYEFDREENMLTVTFEGDDMGVLIGKRGQTLDSVQYLISLVVNRNVTGYVHVKADTENYRARRKKTLENLARNVASKVKRTHRAQALEPMNPYERRIIHSALQGDSYVTTYSEGEDPYRRVVISPKR